MSPRQRQVLALQAHGHTEREIATLLGIGAETVKEHSKMVRRKLGARSKAHAVALAFQTGLLQ